ncbi:MAG: hypothetical protein HYZ57_16235 [Acidobacteria bacterium]|nr:hypothetical protein [Acidobacteriota bacterium]MBI3281383.1 hypothetical protein [Acidobacteriota bacterium]
MRDQLRIPPRSFLAEANHDTALIFHIEGKDGVEALDGILALGVDMAFLGPYTASRNRLATRRVEAPQVRQKMLEVVEKGKQAGKRTGTYCDDIETARGWRRIGIRYLAVSIDAAIFPSSGSHCALAESYPLRLITRCATHCTRATSSSTSIVSTCISN